MHVSPPCPAGGEACLAAVSDMHATAATAVPVLVPVAALRRGGSSHLQL